MGGGGGGGRRAWYPLFAHASHFPGFSANSIFSVDGESRFSKVYMYTCYIADIRTSAVIYFVAEMRWWLALASVTSYKRFVQPSFLTTMSVIREGADGRSGKEPLMPLSS